MAMLSEYAPDRRRGLFSTSVDCFAFLAFLAGSALVLLLTAVLGSAAMEDWGWRIPFLVAGPLGVVGLYLRSRLEDTPDFRAIEQDMQVLSTPLRTSFTKWWRQLLFCGGFVVIKAVGQWMLLAFLTAYMVEFLDFSGQAPFGVTTVALLVTVGLMPLMGIISDRIGRRPMIIGACVGFILFTYPLLMLMDSHSVVSAAVGMTLIGLFVAVFNGGSGAAMAELFPTRIRYGGMSVGYNVAVAVFGGLTPYLATFLISKTDNLYSPAFPVMAAALITLVVAVKARETAGQPLQK